MVLLRESAFDPKRLEVLSTRKHALAALGDRRASLGGNKRLAALALIHSVHNHTDDDGNDSTTHTTADQREIWGLEVHSSLDADVRYWHFSEIPPAPTNVDYWAKAESGQRC
jgi:hypothetical protein